MAAQAADSTAAGTLTAGQLSNTAPAVTAFSTTLTGVTQTVNTALGAWNVTDATGSNAGYRVTVAATDPTVAGSTAGAGTGGDDTLTPIAATTAGGNPATTLPTADAAQALSTTAATDNAAAGSDQVQGTIRPEGAKAITINRPVMFTAAKAKQLTNQTPPVPRSGASATPGWVWIALAGAAALLVGLLFAVYKLARRPTRVAT